MVLKGAGPGFSGVGVVSGPSVPVNEGGHGGTSETVPELPYLNVDGPAGEIERRKAAAAADVANTALERKLEEREVSEQAKAALRDRQASLFRPRGNYLLVKMECREKTAAGILLPDAKQEIPGHGVVVAVGPSVSHRFVDHPAETHPEGSLLKDRLFVPNIAPGDSLFFSRFVGATLEFPDGVADPRYRVMSEDEVYGSWSSE